MNRREIPSGEAPPGSRYHDYPPLLIRNNAPPAYETNHWPTKPYDPVAVLEAIPDRFLICTERDPQAIAAEQWWASILDCSLDSSFENQDKFPDFPSAVRWLHGQAAAADTEFAKQFPVPEN